MNHWMHISTHLGPFYRVLRSKTASTHSLAHDLIFIIESQNRQYHFDQCYAVIDQPYKTDALQQTSWLAFKMPQLPHALQETLTF